MLNVVNSVVFVSDVLCSLCSLMVRCYIELSSLLYDSVDVGELCGSCSMIMMVSVMSVVIDVVNIVC